MKIKTTTSQATKKIGSCNSASSKKEINARVADAQSYSLSGYSLLLFISSITAKIQLDMSIYSKFINIT
jgi:hypothetical protein